MLRPNMFGVWMGFCSVVFVYALIQKRYTIIFRYIFYFLCGAITVISPMVIYLYINNAIADFLYQYLTFNNLYASDSVTVFTYLRNAYFTLNKVYSWLLIAVATFWLIKNVEIKKYPFYIAYFLTTVISILLISLSKSNFGHYSMTLIPLFVPALSFCINTLFKHLNISNMTMKYLFLLLFLCFAFNAPISCSLKDIYRNIKSVSKYEIAELCGIIDTNTKELDKITVLGNDCKIYFYSNRTSASKYIYQIPIAEVSPEIAGEYLNDIMTRKPALIIVPVIDNYLQERASTMNSNLKQVSVLIDEEYSEIYNKNGYIVFQKKEKA
jgi:hypothetical protein